MSICTITTIQNRIKSATAESKIAVFITSRGRTIEFNAVFDNTISTKEKIKKGCGDYVGSYHNGISKQDLIIDLNNATKMTLKKIEDIQMLEVA